MIKNIFLTLLGLIVISATTALAQTGHTLQIDDGAGHYTTLIASPGGSGVLTFPAGPGTVLTSSGGVSPVWLVGGNNNPTSSIIGTLTAQDFLINTTNITRATFSKAPSATIPVLTLTNNASNGIQGVRINGSLDATSSSTLAGNPGVWDMVVDGDEVVTGVFKTGGSLWFDGNSLTHTITADKPLNIATSSNDSVMISTNNTTRMTIARNGFIGVGTKNPVCALHIVGTPPDPTISNAATFLTPDPYNHVMTVENLASSYKGNGIAIIIHNPSGSITPFTAGSDGAFNNNQTNYITFYNDAGDHNHVKGRVEGFSYENFTSLKTAIEAVGSIFSDPNNYNPFNYFTFQMAFDPNFITYNPGFVSFDPGSLPTFTGGSWPSISTCSIDIGICSIYCYSIDYPCGFNTGSWPTYVPGSLPSLSFSSPFTINGSPITHLTDPFAINYTFINNLVAPLMDLPYKDKVASIVGDPIAAAVAFGTSFLGGVTYESGSGDYAEWLERADHNETINIGDVVSVTGGKISKNTDGASQLMVTSWKPCVLGNMPEEGKEQFSNKVAFMGQIPVKMRCAVKQGDYIIPSGFSDGFANAISPKDIKAEDLDKVLGVAWEDAPDAGVKFVKIAVGLKPHEMVSVIKDHAERIKTMQTKALEINELSAELNDIKASLPAAKSVKFTKKKSKHSKLISSN